MRMLYIISWEYFNFDGCRSVDSLHLRLLGGDGVNPFKIDPTLNAV